MKKKKWIILGSIGTILLLYFVFGRKSANEPAVSVEAAGLKDITESVAASGRIYPEVEVKISSDVSGEIVELLVIEGDSVRQGQLLCRINPELYETALAQMRASLNNAKAAQANAEAQLSRTKASFQQQQQNYNRQQKLFKEKVIAVAEFEAAESAYLMAEAELSSAEKNVLASRYNVESAAARLEESVRNFGRTSIYAPLSGIITSLSIKKGERVVGTSQMAGTEMMRIAQFDLMEMRVDVNENDIIRIKKDDTAAVEIDAYKREKFKGVVTHVARSMKSVNGAVSDQQAVTYEVRVRLLPASYAKNQKEGQAAPFWPGMTGSVDIITRTEKGVLSIPVSAVTMREALDSKEGDKKEVVFVAKEDVVYQKNVKTGIQDGNYIRVLEGLEEGDVVVNGPYGIVSAVLAEGMKIKVADKSTLYQVQK
jgi:HlyD family secretion protein